MRTEQEMMDLILGIAKDDDRIRAVYINGSRANLNAPKDVYQDYDIVFVVTETGSFLADKSWILKFGNPLIVQEPDWNDNVTHWFGDDFHDSTRRYAWLMLFDDGNRIDLGIELIEETLIGFKEDPLTIILIDKDGLLPAIPPPSDKIYHIKPPNEDIFHACCNEFWWCLNNVAKGAARDELPYTKGMYDHYVRDMLNLMIEWYIGVQTDFSVSAGKMGKYFKRYLPPELYTQYTATFSGSDSNDVWTSVYMMCDLFHILAKAVAAHFGFSYRHEEENGIRKYLKMVRDYVL